MKKILVILTVFIGTCVYSQDPYFVTVENKFPTTTLGMITDLSFDKDVEVQSIGVSLMSIGFKGVGIYLDAKWGEIDRYNGGIAVRLGNMLKLYTAAGFIYTGCDTDCYNLNLGGGVYAVLPIRLGVQCGVDYCGDFKNSTLPGELVLNVGLNYTF